MADQIHQPVNGESQSFGNESLRTVTGNTSDFPELARDCVCFVNGPGGTSLIDIEDGAAGPPPMQRIQIDLIAE